MRVLGPAALLMALAALTPAVAAEPGPSYSLEELQSLARSAHPTLASAEAAVEASAGIVRQARAYPNPEISLAYGRGRPREGGDSASENRIELVQPLELPGIRRGRAQVAELQQRGAEIDRELSAIVVDATVARLAYTVLFEKRRAAIAAESAAIAGRLHALLAHKAALGESASLEVTRAQAEWFARRRDGLDAAGARDAARAALRLLCGDRLSEEYTVAETLADPRATDLPGDLRARLRANNPLLLRAGLAVEAAQARTEVAKQEGAPVLELFAGHETELDREAASVGVGLTIPLWNRNRGNVAASAAAESVAAAEARALALELEGSLEQASAAYRQALAAVRLHQEGWTSAAERSLEIVTFSFENGEASLLDVLDAQRAYLSVGLAEAQSWAGLAFARHDIERLIAGPIASEGTHEAP